MPWNRQPLPFFRRAKIEALESRLLLSVGLFTADQDIGSPTQPGAASFSNGVYTISADGTGIGNGSDQCNFAYESLPTTGAIIAQITSVTNGGASAQAGVMVRADLTASSALAAVLITPSSGIEWIYRPTDGGFASESTFGGIQAPKFVQLTISASTITGSYSSNGSTWSTLGSATISLGAGPLVGLAASATTTQIGNVTILPNGWSDADIGAPPLPGSAGYNYASNQFTLTGAGTGVAGSADQLNFLSYPMTGDGSFTALLNSQSGVNPSAASAAGVMIRSDTTAGSLVAAIELTAQSNVEFIWRSLAGSSASATAPVLAAASLWLRLSDSSNSFSAYFSTDDINWTQVGSTQAIAMPSAVTLAGLFAFSASTTAENTAVFSSASLLRGGWSDLDIGSPALAGSTEYDSPSDTYTIQGNGSDIWGTADQFNFASTTMTGNGSAIAYVDSITDTDPWAKAGVMIRNDNTAGSAFAAVLVSPTSGITFEWRSSAGASADQEVNSPAGGPVPTPVGLELTRLGNSFTALYSTDGMTWTQIGPAQSITIGATALAGVAVTSHNTAALCTATFSSVGIGADPPPGAGIYSSSDQLFLNTLENREVDYYYDETSATTGLVPDNANANGGSPSADSSIAAIGFGLSALTIGDARGWLSHANAYQRALNTIDFLYNSGANVNGFFYHFLNETTGARYGTSEVSSVDTAELMAGVLSAGQYWAGTPLQTTALALYDRVDWPWMEQASGVFYGAWTPESGFSGGYGDFSEAVLLYLLGLGSPTYPIKQSAWLSWSRTPKVNYSGYSFVTADDAALFTVQYPQAWFNLQGLVDADGLNYYQNAQTATLAQRQFMINLSSTYSDYGPNLWGLTPSEGVSGYTVWGGPPAYGPIDGTVVPTAPGGSLEFEPRLSLNVLENMQQTYGSTVYQKYGLVDAFNPGHWTSSLVLGIDLGMMLISAENSRSDLVWNGFMQTSAAQQAVLEAFPPSPPVIVSAVSRKTVAGENSDVPINLSGALSVDPRQGGPTELVLTFSSNIVVGPGFGVTLTSASGPSDGAYSSISTNGATMTINLSGTINAQVLVVTIDDVRINSTAASGDYTLELGVLLADANEDGQVNGSDYTLIDNGFNQNLTGWQNGDFNNDGIINGDDYTLIDNAFNTAATLQSIPANLSVTTLIQSTTAPLESLPSRAKGTPSARIEATNPAPAAKPLPPPDDSIDIAAWQSWVDRIVDGSLVPID